jgi:hypothetical protein
MKRMILFGLIALGGCAAIQRGSVENKENDFAAAGFNVLPLNSPARAQMVASLPPNKVSRRFEGDHVSYLYPDPMICNCLYVGSQSAWGRYQAALQARNTPVFTVVDMPGPGYGWDWGPWGGYGRGFYD